MVKYAIEKELKRILDESLDMNSISLKEACKATNIHYTFDLAQGVYADRKVSDAIKLIEFLNIKNKGSLSDDFISRLTIENSNKRMSEVF